MNPVIEALYRHGVPSQADVDAFVRDNQFPLIEPGRVTFIYRGFAEEVHLRRWISGLSTEQPLQPLEDSGLWALTMDLPDNSRFEYKFEVMRGGARHLVLDELNGVLAHDPFGANSVCQGYGYRRPAWTLHDATARSGSLASLSLYSAAFQQQREVQVYVPARFRRNRQPSVSARVIRDGGSHPHPCGAARLVTRCHQVLGICDRAAPGCPGDSSWSPARELWPALQSVLLLSVSPIAIRQSSKSGIRFGRFQIRAVIPNGRDTDRVVSDLRRFRYDA